jgi:murein DD-endopeptidase MepM/ murein hydrolase activator NlpD
MSSIGVEVGERVAVGATLGSSGATGNVTGAHLHLEVIVGGTPIDPFAWLKRHGVRA